MASKPTSQLVELLKLLRRIIVLGVAAYGLARGMPYLTLLFRLAVLYAVLYICSGIVDAVFRRLQYHAALRQQADVQSSPEPRSSEKKNLPAVSTSQAR